jgi:hypothetical protein
MDPIEVSPTLLILGKRTIKGWSAGTPTDSEDTPRFADAVGIRPMIEKYPQEKAAEGYARMMSGDAQYRVVDDGIKAVSLGREKLAPETTFGHGDEVRLKSKSLHGRLNLKRNLLIPRILILDSNVWRGRPSFAATDSACGLR